ncbi:MAG: hypothetical protein IJL44_05485 [Bacteroidales bacterium]|nr:hypothetical protein [Bacteroidales bacterium]
MKKTLIFAIAIPLAMAMAGCGSSTPKENNKDKTHDQQPQTEVVETQQEVVQEAAQEAEPEVKEPGFPWDFPEGNKNEGLADGQTILSIQSFYPNALKEKENPANETYIFYNAVLTSVGDTKSTVRYFGEDIEMPNALIIPIPAEQQAKKGDIVLTWWQTGSGMQRAIVKDASNPSAPKVDYLDLSYKEDGKGFANEHADEQLKPNSFVVLKDGEWQPGAQVVVSGDGSFDVGTLISCTDDKVLLKCFAGKIRVFKRSACKLIPLKQNLKPGDEVMSIFAGSLKTGYKVKKVDEKIGRVWVEGSFGDDIVNILEVYKL